MFKKTDSSPGPGLLTERIRNLKDRVGFNTSESSSFRKSQKRAERQPVYKQATLTLESGQKITVAIKNLSDSGARVESRERLTLSATVVLSEATLNMKRLARVIWHNECTAGLKFIDQ